MDRSKGQNSYRVSYDVITSQFVIALADGDPISISSPISLVGLCRNENSQNWSKEFMITDHDNIQHRVIIPNADLLADPLKVIRLLADHGFELTAPTLAVQKQTINLLANLKSQVRKTITRKCGWLESNYVTPSYSVGKSQNIVFSSDQSIQIATQTSGTLEEWQKNVAAYCYKNRRLELALSTALAGPLLSFLKVSNFGLHFYGPSSCGKTLAARIASSVWGKPRGVNGYIQSWRNTGNALEGIALASNDNVLVLDEIGEVLPEELSNIIYMLGNGAGKGRANVHGNTIPRKQFNLVFLSTGELSTEAICSQGRKSYHGGNEVRCLNLSADMDGGFGILEYLHGSPDSRSLAKNLEKTTDQYYGIAGKEFLEKLVHDIEFSKPSLINKIDSYRECFLKGYINFRNHQVSRVQDHFATLAVAGELGIEYQILPFEKGSCIESAIANLNDWINESDRSNLFDDQKCLDQIRSFIQEFGLSRFANIADNAHGDSCGVDPGSAPRALAQAGYRGKHKGIECYFIFPRIFKEELCKGYNPRRAAKILLSKGALITDSPSQTYICKTISGKPQKVYAIAISLLDES